MRQMWAETMYERVYNAKTGGTETVQGDVNADGVFSVNDAVLLQKWLLAVPDTKLADWKAADFNEDGKLWCYTKKVDKKRKRRYNKRKARRKKK